MESTDDLIKGITGTDNYMKELEKVSGNLNTIDLKFVSIKLEELAKADESIRSCMKRLYNDETINYFKLAIENDFTKAIEIKTKTNKKTKKTKTSSHLSDRFRPNVFIKSDYFKLIKKIEKTCNNLIEAYNINLEVPKYDSIRDVLKTNPELMDIKNLFGKKILSDEEVELVVVLKKSAHQIITIYLLPFYDVRGVMMKNWNLLAPMFNKNINVGANTVEIQDMLYLFLIAKYRCEITGKNKYYMKMFMDVINKNSTEEEGNLLATMDSARFLELLDTINFDSIGQKKEVYNFAIKSKDIIKRIVKRKDGETMTDILKDIEKVLSGSHNEVEEKIESVVEDNENANILIEI